MMRGERKSRKRLNEEIEGLRRRIAELEETISQLKQVHEDISLEPQFRNLAESCPVSIAVYQEGRILYANQANQDMCGYTLEEQMSMDPLDILHPDYRPLVREMAEARQRGEDLPSMHNVKIITKGGEERWWSMTGKYFEFDGRPATLGIGIDITESKESGEALRKSEEKYRLVSENIPCVVYSALPDENSTNLFISGRIVGLTGYTAEQFFKDTGLWTRLVHSDDRVRAWEEIAEHRRKKSELDLEYRIITKDGAEKWISDKATPVLDEEGRIIRIDGFMQDISGRKKAEKAINERDAFYSSIIEKASEAFLVLDAEGFMVYMSPRVEELLGVKPAELLDQRAPDYFKRIHPDDVEEVARAYRYCFDNPGATVRIQLRARHADGSWRILGMIGTNLLEDPSVRGVVARMRDITERKREEEELIRLSTAVKMSNDSITILDLEGRIVDCNDVTLEMYGAGDKRDLVGKSAFDLVVPEDRETVNVLMTEVLEKGQGKEIEFTLPTMRKKMNTVEISVALIRDSSGSPIGFVGIARDITERKKAEEALRESEETGKVLLNGITDSAMLFSPDWTFIAANQTAAARLGKEVSDLVGTNLFEHLPPEVAERRRAKAEEVIRTRKPLHFADERAGIVFENRVYPILDNQGEIDVIIVFARDITEHVWMEEELLAHSHEMESFVNTVSHDLRNPLAIIKGFALTAQDAHAKGLQDVEDEAIGGIVRAVERMDELIETLLQYAKAGMPAGKAVRTEPEEVWGEALEGLKPALASRHIKMTAQRDLPPITVDPVRLYQVLSNLVDNAIKHMGDVPDPRIEFGAEREGKTATFHIHDNGKGIPLDKLTSVFEPFKSYSVTGKPGLGIGLSTVKKAVEAWGGVVWVESEPGKGCTFYFSAPAA